MSGEGQENENTLQIEDVQMNTNALVPENGETRGTASHKGTEKEDTHPRLRALLTCQVHHRAIDTSEVGITTLIAGVIGDELN